jgi:REP element-mobilizing transposase RayT
MNDKFRNKYRIATARVQWWDYSQNGAYFITICTHNKMKCLGMVVDGAMQLSEIGMIVKQEWEKSFVIRQELFCDSYIIMPNHIHAILRIEQQTCIDMNTEIDDINNDGIINDTVVVMVVETHGRASLPQPQPPVRAPKLISSFVAGFKSSSTKRINEYRQTPRQPMWQPRFHDHIIRNDAAYIRIAEYIANNPTKWANDVFYKKAIPR